MSHEAVGAQQEHSQLFEGMSLQDVWIYLDTAKCSDIERRVVQGYMDGMENDIIAHELNIHSDFVEATLVAVDIKLHNQKTQMITLKSDQLLRTTASGQPTFLRSGTTLPRQQSPESYVQKHSMQPSQKAVGKIVELSQLPADDSLEWTMRALCRPGNSGETINPDMFYPADKDAKALQAAKAICQRCVVRHECLQAALDNKEAFGVWGGTAPVERREMMLVQHKRL